MDFKSGYSHSVVAPDGLVVDHFVGRPTLTMEQCREGGFCAADFERPVYAQASAYHFDPSADRYDRRATVASARR